MDAAGAERLAVPRQVAVVGAGRMGAGIAHAFLTSGSEVLLRDESDAAANRGRDAVAASVRRSGERGTLRETVDDTLGRLSAAVGLGGLAGADLVVEAVPELPALKADVWRQLSAVAPLGAVFASNTSSISIEALAGSVTAPERFLGLHFFNPVPVSRLVELVRSDVTAEAVVNRAATWTRAIGKEPIIVADTPGFATSRLGVALGLEAIRMLQDGVASAEDIDRGMVLGYGFPVGPLRLTDIVGLDVRLEIAEYLHAQLGERFAPPALLRERVADGDLGRKTGQGFYTWPAQTPLAGDSHSAAAVRSVTLGAGKEATTPSPSAGTRRCWRAGREDRCG